MPPPVPVILVMIPTRADLFTTITADGSSATTAERTGA